MRQSRLVSATYGPFCSQASSPIRAASGIAIAAGLGGLMWACLVLAIHAAG